VIVGRAPRIGSIAVGKHADPVIVKDNPGTKITDIETLRSFSKDGVGYDSEKLIQSGEGSVGRSFRFCSL